MKMAIKTGDTVVVIAGKEKGKTGKVLEVNPETNRVLVENINIVKKHQKPRSQQDKGGIIEKAAPIEASNVQVICPVCGKATRVAHREIEGEKVRSCKKCNGSLDKKFVKQTKKEVKKVEKSAKKEEAPKAEVKKSAPKAEPKTTATKTAKTTEAKATTAKAAAKPAEKATTTAKKTSTQKSTSAKKGN